MLHFRASGMCVYRVMSRASCKIQQGSGFRCHRHTLHGRKHDQLPFTARLTRSKGEEHEARGSPSITMMHGYTLPLRLVA
jgi:hypothetical protein